MNDHEAYKNSVAAALIELDLHHIKTAEAVATADRNFDDLKMIAEAEAAVDTLLRFIERM